MKTELSQHLLSLRFGEPQTFKHVVMIPLLSPDQNGTAYITLDEALADQQFTVTEVSQFGSVPNLKVINSGNVSVLLLDGEEVAGAKQNRVLNTSILVAAKSELVVPVTCTEQGRWSDTSKEMVGSDAVMAHKIRARKSRSVSSSLEFRSNYIANQGEVWMGIHDLHQKAHFHSPTHAMSDLYKAREQELKEALQVFPLLPGQKGMMVIIGGEVAGVDTLSRNGAYARLHPKLVRSYVLDALLDKEQPAPDPGQVLARSKAFLEEAASCEVKAFASVGLGQDVRLTSPHLVGTALVHEGTVIHAALFRSEQDERGASLAALRRRRGFHSS